MKTWVTLLLFVLLCFLYTTQARKLSDKTKVAEKKVGVVLPAELADEEGSSGEDNGGAFDGNRRPGPGIGASIGGGGGGGFGGGVDINIGRGMGIDAGFGGGAGGGLGGRLGFGIGPGSGFDAGAGLGGGLGGNVHAGVGGENNGGGEGSP